MAGGTITLRVGLSTGPPAGKTPEQGAPPEAKRTRRLSGLLQAKPSPEPACLPGLRSRRSKASVAAAAAAKDGIGAEQHLAASNADEDSCAPSASAEEFSRRPATKAYTLISVTDTGCGLDKGAGGNMTRQPVLPYAASRAPGGRATAQNL